MFKMFFNLWRGGSLVSEMVNEFGEMLDLAKTMFVDITNVLYHGQDLTGMREDFFARDKRINDLESDIRRKIIIHLTQQPGADVAAALIMMSVVKDAERIGDYSKNILEVFEATQLLNDDCTYRNKLLELTKAISIGFDRTKTIFQTSDVQAAENFIKQYLKLGQDCDLTVNSLLEGDDEAESPVAYALLFRFYKRILAHQTNIVSSLTVPVDKLDHHDEPLKPPLKKGHLID